MAHIFYGNKRRFEENIDVATAAASLSDEFWCLFEFDIPLANIDCLIIKAAEGKTTPETASTFLLTETKHVSGRLRGSNTANGRSFATGSRNRMRQATTRMSTPGRKRCAR